MNEAGPAVSYIGPSLRSSAILQRPIVRFFTTAKIFLLFTDINLFLESARTAVRLWSLNF